MEHPWLFLVKFCEMLGPGPAHFAHEYPHVLYTWLVMLFLIAMGILGGKSIKLIPGKAQNFFEVVVSGIEEFMVDVTGEEGRWLLPSVGNDLHFYLHRQPDRDGTDLLPSHRGPEYDLGLCPGRGHFYAYYRR